MGFCTSYLHVRYTWFLTGKIYKKKRKKQDSEKNNFIYALHFFVSLTFCTYLKRLTSVSGMTEQISRSAEILYNMYMYFYSYAYKYMSVICLLCVVSFTLPPPCQGHADWGLESYSRKTALRGQNMFLSCNPSTNRKKHSFWGGFALSLAASSKKKESILEFFVLLIAIAKQTPKHWTF